MLFLVSELWTHRLFLIIELNTIADINWLFLTKLFLTVITIEQISERDCLEIQYFARWYIVFILQWITYDMYYYCNVNHLKRDRVDTIHTYMCSRPSITTTNNEGTFFSNLKDIFPRYYICVSFRQSTNH